MSKVRRQGLISSRGGGLAFGVFLALAMLLVLPVVALADGLDTIPTIEVSPNPVAAGTDVTLTSTLTWTSTALHSGGTLKIQECKSGGVGVAASNCDPLGPGSWTDLATIGGSPSATSPFSGAVTFDTTGLGGSTIGFRTLFVTGGGSHRLSTSQSAGTDLVITASNVAPTITSVTNDGAINEGGSATITVTATDADSDPLTYEFDCDNDSTYEVGPQVGNTNSCAFGNDGSYTVNVRVSDGTDSDTDSTVVTVNNVAPTITTVTNSGAINEGGSATITVTATDPFDALTYDYDCDGDLAYEALNAGASNSCAFGNDGSYTVNVRVNDDDTSTLGSTVVTVNYAFGGLLSPLGPGPSVWKAGSTIPVKFKLTDADGNPVGTATATASLLTTAASAACKYDPIAQQYICNLKTPKGISGSYTIQVSLDDGTSYTTVVQMKP
jgi:hypothetical protein